MFMSITKFKSQAPFFLGFILSVIGMGNIYFLLSMNV